MVRLLEMRASGQEVAAVKPPIVITANSSVSLDDLLESTTHVQLKAFIRQQTAEFSQLVGNLRVFAQGTEPTDSTAENYNHQIAATITATRLQFMNSSGYDDYYVDSVYAHADDDQVVLQEELAPFRDLAEKYQAQQNWLESAKIQEAIVHACGQTHLDGGKQDEDEYDYWYGEAFRDGCHMQASNALAEWATLIPKIKNGQDKLSLIERFVVLFVSDVYEFGSWYWEDAFQLAFQSQSDAEIAIRFVDARPQGDDIPLPAGALLHLLGLTDDTDRFLRVARTALPQIPHLALPLANKLMAIGDRQSAVQMAEEAVAKRTPMSVDRFDQRVPRKELLRFLIEALDPQSKNRQLRRHADMLFFESGALHDYKFLRDLMTMQAERQQLLQQVQEKCSLETVNEILNYEECWDELLTYSQLHVQKLPLCPQLLHSLHDRFPASCFDLYHKLVVDYLNRGTGQHLYDNIAIFVRQMQALPGQGDSFGNLMVWIHDNYQRRINLMQALDEFITIGFEWHNRQVQEAYKNLTLEKVEELDLAELARYCPLTRTATKQSEKGWQAAALIWAVLLQHGGSMEAGLISAVIARELRISPSTAKAMRSKGLRLLELLHHVEVVREHNRISQVNLLAGLIT